MKDTKLSEDRVKTLAFRCGCLGGIGFMNFMNLKYFLVTAQEMNITKAARKLYLTQQTLSNHIIRLEEELHTQLFERYPSLKLTYSGMCFVRYAEHILDMQQQFEQELKEIAGEDRGVLSVGVTRTRARLLIPRVLPRYCKLHPKIEVKLKIINSAEIAQELLNGNIDLMMCVQHASMPDSINTIPLASDRFCLAISRDTLIEMFPLNSEDMIHYYNTQGPDLSAFRNVPFLLNSKSRLRSIADRIFNQNHIAPNVLLEAPDTQMLLNLCANGLGATFSFEMSAQEALNYYKNILNEQPLLVFPFELPDEPIDVVIGYDKLHYLGRPAKEFINTALEAFKRDTIFKQ